LPLAVISNLDFKAFSSLQTIFYTSHYFDIDLLPFVVIVK